MAYIATITANAQTVVTHIKTPTPEITP